MSTANNTQSSHVARVKLLAHKLADTVLNTTHDTLHAYVPELIAPTEATTLASMLFLVATSVYFAAWLSLGWAWLILLFGLLSSVFEKQLSRLRTRIRADERRSLANETFLDESVEWLNALLLRFWLRFEPGLSVTIQQIADLSLASFKPVFLSDLRLSKFSLGSANPVITTIRTHARSNESLTLDLDLQFVPHEHAASNSEQRNLVVQLLARVGLGPASVPLTVVLTDVALHGTMRVELDFSAAFPHIQTVKLAFVEAPLLDYQLKPLGTGDINSIAAIASFLSSTVSSALSSFIVHPNYLTLDIAALMGVGDHDLPVGILRIRLHEAAGLRNVDIASLSDPYAIVTIGDQEIARTRTLFDDLSPKWAQTFDVVVTRAMLASPLDLLQIKVIHAGKLGPVSLGATESLSLVRWVQLLDTASTSPTTSESDPQVPNMSEKAEKAEPEKNDAEFPSGEVNAPRALDDKEAVQIVRQWGSPLYERSDRWLSLYDYSLQPTKGAVHADMAYFPIDPAVKILSNAGLVTLTIHQAKDLPSRRQGHPFVLVNFRGDVIGKTSVKKRTSSPVWAHTIRFFCEDITDAFVRLAVHDDQKFSISDLASPVYGECLLPITEALNEHGEWYPLKNPSSPGKLKIDLQFTPVDLAQSDVDRTLIPRFAPVGVVRLHIIEAKELTNVELLRKSDPYVKVKVGRTRVGVTQAIENTLDPEWRETFYGIAYSAETLLSLELYDFNEIQKDKWLGKVAIPLDMLVKGSLQPCRSEQDQRDMDNLRNAYNVDGLKVSAKQGSTDSLDVWAPVYISKHSAADPKTAAHAASKDSLHPSDADHIGIAGVGAAVGAVGAGAHSLVRSATSFAKDLTKGKDSKMKAKGRIHFELDFFPVHEPIVRTTYPSPRVLEDGTLDCIHATPIDQNAREIVSTQSTIL